MESCASGKTNLKEKVCATGSKEGRQEADEVSQDSWRHSFIVKEEHGKEEEKGDQEEEIGESGEEDGNVHEELQLKQDDQGYEEKEEEEEEEGRQDDEDDVEISTSSVPVDRGYAWVIVLACFALQFLMTGFVRCIGLFFVEIQNQFQSSSTMTSLVVGVQEATVSVTSFTFLVFVLERTNPRVGCLFGSFFLTVGVAGNYLATNAQFVIFTLGACLGLALGTAYGASLIVISEYFVRRRALATSFIMAGASMGGMTMPLLARHLLDTYGFHGGFLMLGAVVSHAFVFAMLLIPVRNWALWKGKSPNSPAQPITDDSDVISFSDLPANNKCETHVHGYDSEKVGSEKEKEKQTFISYEFEENDTSHKLLNDGHDHKALIDRLNGKLNSVDNMQLVEETKKQNSLERLSPNNKCISKLAFIEGVELKESTKHNGLSLPAKEIRADSTSIGSHTNVSSIHADTSRHYLPARMRTLSQSSDLSSRKRTWSQFLDLPDRKRTWSQFSDLPARNRKLSQFSDIPSRNRKLSQFSGIFTHSTTTVHSVADLRKLSFYDIATDIVSTTPTEGRQTASPCGACARSERAKVLVRSAGFWAMLLFHLLAWVGNYLSFTYIAPLAKERGLSDGDVAFFVSLLNMLDLPARLLPGIIVNTGHVSPSKVCVLPMVAVATVGYFTSFMNSYESLLGLVLVYGALGGVYLSMQSLIVIQVVGLELYPVALAVSYLVMSFGATAFFPVTGCMKDSSSTYTTPFYYLATFQLISVAILLGLPFFKRYDVRRGLLL